MYLFFRKHIGLAVVVALSLVPVVRWAMLAPLELRFISINEATTSIGQIAGLVGMTMFSLNLILSARSKFWDELFYGLNNLYNIHSKVGSIAFSLILFHPILLAIKYFSVSLKAAALFLLPSQDIAVNYGIAALLTMMLLIVITFYIKIKYHYWKMSHKFMVLAFILAMVHVAMITSNISQDGFLRVYIFGLAIIGVSASFYQAFLSKFVNLNLEYVVQRTTQLNDRIIEIEAEPKNKVMGFEPGQFIFVRFKSDGVSSESHPFSITSALGDKNLKLVIKSLGDFTSGLKNLKAGDVMMVDGPYGKFSYQEMSNKNQIWLAGGVGITPFLSMARSLTNDYKVDLFYCTATKDEAVLYEELARISLANPNFRLISWCSGNQGFINGEKISDLSSGFEDKDILLCGPGGFMRNLRKQLTVFRVKNKNIHSEEFKFL